MNFSKIENTLSGCSEKQSPAKYGRVFLVGAGPGDPELLTVKALRLIQKYDIILYDNLVSDEIKSLFPEKARKFFVGKKKNNHSIPQQELNHLIVVRLKKDTPFVV